MKTRYASLLLIIWFSAAGCYHDYVLFEGDPLPEDRSVTFNIVDGSSLISRSGDHRRVDDGYQVKGILVDIYNRKQYYAGVVHDKEIDFISVSEPNSAGTIALCAGTIVVGALLVWATTMNPATR